MGMDNIEYITAKEAAEKWNISLRRVQKLCEQGRIPRIRKLGRAWIIPVNAEKPADPRKDKECIQEDISSELKRVIAATCLRMPLENPDMILRDVKEERFRLQYEGELSYLRGDFVNTMRCCQRTEGDDASRLRASMMGVAAAISLGDYRAYTELESYLNGCIEAYTGSNIAIVAELALASVAVSVNAPGLVPHWLKEGDLSDRSVLKTPYVCYLRAKYFFCICRYEAMLTVAQTALTLGLEEQTITFTDIYLMITCAIACCHLDRREDARHWLMQSMHICMPHGFITPFAETIAELGGLVEQCLEQEFPDYYNSVIEQFERTVQNWIAFHNDFAKDNITYILSLREYHIAKLVARRVPYSKIAKQHYISVGRLKNIVTEIYDKLCISGRDELAAYVNEIKK